MVKKLREWRDINAGIVNIAELAVPAYVKFKLGMLRSVIGPKIQLADEVNQKLLARYADPEKGRITNAGKVLGFYEEWDPIQNEEIDAPWEKMKLDMLCFAKETIKDKKIDGPLLLLAAELFEE